MSWLEGVALTILLIAVATMGAAITLSNGAVARAVRQMERTYRRERARQQEAAQAAALQAHAATLSAELAAEATAWRPLVDRLYARLYGTPRRALQVQCVATTPAPYLEVGFQDGGPALVLTPQPEALAAAGVLSRAEARAAAPVDATLYVTARLEARLIWLQQAQHHGETLPEEAVDDAAAWYAIVRAPHRWPARQERSNLTRRGGMTDV